ncbi:MAG: hypothetical protein RLZZ595_1472 [Bacteroidota bacterium]|jgi:hypothetical protein
MMHFKKYISLFLLVLAGLPLIVSCMLAIQQYWIRHEMLEKLENENLQMITLHIDEVKWEKKDKELILGATLFDVKYSIKKNDTILFYGLFDKEESRLLKIVDYNTTNNNKEKTISSIIVFLTHLTFLNIKPADFSVKSIKSQLTQYLKKTSIPLCPYRIILSPPPDGFCC